MTTQAPKRAKAGQPDGAPQHLLTATALSLGVVGLSFFVNPAALSLNIILIAQIVLAITLSFFWRRVQQPRWKKMAALFQTLSLWFTMIGTALLAADLVGHYAEVLSHTARALVLINGLMTTALWLSHNDSPSQTTTTVHAAAALALLVTFGYGWKNQVQTGSHDIALSAKNTHVTSASHDEKAAHDAQEPGRQDEQKNQIDEVHWGYSGENGPQFWGDLKNAFGACSHGQEQSPIDIAKNAKTTLGVQLKYKASSINPIDNGHTLQFNLDPGSSAILNNETFALKQFHFHAPSEHTVNGVKYPLELHFVHQSPKGQLAVVGVFVERGAPNKTIEQLMTYFPEPGVHDLLHFKERFNPNSLLPQNRKTFQYAGSLTTPPCSEGVLWNVLTQAITMSEEQIKAFVDRYDANARPVQPLYTRIIGEYPEAKAYHH